MPCSILRLVRLYLWATIKILALSWAFLARVTIQSEFLIIKCIAIAAFAVIQVQWQLFVAYVSILTAIPFVIIPPIIDDVSAQLGIVCPSNTTVLDSGSDSDTEIDFSRAGETTPIGKDPTRWTEDMGPWSARWGESAISPGLSLQLR